ncbi:hypothetical protein ACFQPA_16985 [Halomarina halobia]|uniref:hypothetical protein n=1 Tax=Halomarina halobia TaxID=3033386 RepID=UPI0023E7C5AA|nr:hypothetical protein [Halomarina sp. PSR21]
MDPTLREVPYLYWRDGSRDHGGVALARCDVAHRGLEREPVERGAGFHGCDARRANS